jgi:hypothetical protein
MSFGVEELRKREFPWTQRENITFLDNAKTGALPARAVKTLATWNERRAEPFRLSTFVVLEVLRITRELVAILIVA